jgi:alpha-1,2-mannosyltransferase
LRPGEGGALRAWGVRAWRSLSSTEPLVVSALVVGLLLVAAGFFQYHLFDFRIFWDAGHHLVDGERLYPSRASLDLETRSYFVYPPFIALAFAPFALLPFAVAGVIYSIIVIVATWATLRILGINDWRCYAVLLFWMPVVQAIELGTIAPLLALALAIAWRYRDRAVVLAFALAFAVAAKLFLWPVILWLVATRRFRSAIACVMATAGLIIVPWALLGFRDLRWYPEALRILLRDEQLMSFSTVAFFKLLHIGYAAIPVELLGVAAVFILARQPDADRRAFGAAIICALLLSPLVWVHYYVVLLVPIALAQRRFGWIWMLPILAFWPISNNQGHWWSVALVSGVMLLAGVIALRRTTPGELRTQEVDDLEVVRSPQELDRWSPTVQAS